MAAFGSKADISVRASRAFRETVHSNLGGETRGCIGATDRQISGLWRRIADRKGAEPRHSSGNKNRDLSLRMCVEERL